MNLLNRAHKIEHNNSPPGKKEVSKEHSGKSRTVETKKQKRTSESIDLEIDPLSSEDSDEESSMSERGKKR